MIQRLHPRLSLSAITAPYWTFEQDLAFWNSVGLSCVGLFERKLEAFGFERAIEELKRRNFKVSSVISHPFSLLDKSLWDAERASFNRCIDVACAVGGAVYGPPGKGRFDAWDESAALYAEAVAPCVDYGKSLGVTVAFEPSLRPQISFVHNLRDSLDLSEVSRADLVVDIGNCYQERDVLKWISSVSSKIALVQVSDVSIGTLENPGAGTRGLPGEGELPIGRFLQASVDAGYQGPFEIEFLGPKEVDQDAFRKSLAKLDALIRQAVD